MIFTHVVARCVFKTDLDKLHIEKIKKCLYRGGTEGNFSAVRWAGPVRASGQRQTCSLAREMKLKEPNNAVCWKLRRERFGPKMPRASVIPRVINEIWG